MSTLAAAQIALNFGGREAEILNHARFRLHVITSRGRHVLRREGRWRTSLGYLGAFASDALSRRALGGWIERVVFSDPRDALPLQLPGLRTRRATLTENILHSGQLASCSIPFALRAVHDIAGAPPGAYWDGGITDYHLHLDYATLSYDAAPALVLYPHFQNTVVPGWLDKALNRRHRATPQLNNLVLLSPQPEWVASLPNGKLPDREDFKRYVDDPQARAVAWTRAVQESARLRDEFAQWLERGSAQDVLQLP